MSASATSPAAALLSPAAIRERCGNIAAAVSAGASRWFRIDRAQLDATADIVAAVTRRRYPDLAIPYHSRWRHFEAGGVDRLQELDDALVGRSVAEAARARIDLVVVSVLLDAGAGTTWSFLESETGMRFARSEGLGVATFRAFMAGAFSAQPDDPLRVDAAALARIDSETLGRVFHDDACNALVGLEGRAELLRRLADALLAEPAIFGDHARPGSLFDAATRGSAGVVSAASLLSTLLAGLNGIWPSRASLLGVPLGDCWRHPLAGGDGPTSGWVPFHKLSQWLAYSLIEPFEWAGVRVVEQDALTALPEYRNGGLLVDAGVVAPLAPVPPDAVLEPGSELVVEWRALTVALIDELAPRVRLRLALPHLPLACILEGGTWAAGRELAQDRRDGAPPFAIRSDGTLF